MARLTNPWTWAAELIDNGYSVQDALRKVADSALSDYGLEVARGNVSGVTQLNKFGRNLTLTSSEETIWDGESDYDTTPGFPASGLITHGWVTADNAADRGVVVVVQGLDENFDEVTETFTTNDPATTAVAFDGASTLQRINRMYITDPSQVIGHIRVGDSGKAAFYSQITAPYNQTSQALYTVPNGKTLYLYQVYADQNDAAGQTVATSILLYAQDSENTGNVRRAHLSLGVTDGGSSHLAHRYPSPWGIPAKWDVYINALTTSGTRDVSAGFEGYLVDT